VALTAGLALCLSTAGAQQEKNDAKVTVEVTSVSISRNPDTKNYPFMFPVAATSVHFLVKCPGKQFLAVDESGKVTEFKDEKGTSLLQKGPFSKTVFSTFPQIAKDRSGMIVSVQTGNVPAKGSTKITLKGTLVARCGADLKTTDAKEVEMKAKTEVKVGDFTISVVNDKGFLGAGAIFNVVSTKPNVKGVTAKDSDGKEVDLVSTGNFGFGNKWTHSYTLKNALKQAKISIHYFAKEEKLNIPIDLTVSGGL
jgi:hypothetical protein